MVLFYKKLKGFGRVYEVKIWGLVQIANACKIARDFVKYLAITKFPGATDYTALRHPLEVYKVLS